MGFNFKQIGRNINNFLGAYDNENANDDEKSIKEIIESTLMHVNVKKVVVPVSGGSHDYLLIDESNEIYISIENNQIDMSNHNFLYKKSFNLNFTDELKRIIRDKLEDERKELKKSLFQNEIGLLNKIKKIYK